jgi:hypothetical protein
MNDLQMVARFTQDVERVLADITEGPQTETADGIVGRLYVKENLSPYFSHSEDSRDAALRNYLVHVGALQRYQVHAMGVLYARAV